MCVAAVHEHVFGQVGEAVLARVVGPTDVLTGVIVPAARSRSPVLVSGTRTAPRAGVT